MTNERFEELVHNLLAYDEARNVLKLSDLERRFSERDGR